MPPQVESENQRNGDLGHPGLTNYYLLVFLACMCCCYTQHRSVGVVFCAQSWFLIPLCTEAQVSKAVN